uniref:Uncharacterized protein n=1 Tax=Glossina pallidipes TaxID=7398 RepID=A0A1A9Z2M3_GLOPL
MYLYQTVDRCSLRVGYLNYLDNVQLGSPKAAGKASIAILMSFSRFSVFSFNIEMDSTLADEAFNRGSKSLCTLCNEARALCNNSADSLSAAPARSSIPTVFSVAFPAAYLDFLVNSLAEETASTISLYALAALMAGSALAVISAYCSVKSCALTVNSAPFNSACNVILDAS